MVKRLVNRGPVELCFGIAILFIQAKPVLKWRIQTSRRHVVVDVEEFAVRRVHCCCGSWMIVQLIRGAVAKHREELHIWLKASRINKGCLGTMLINTH